MGKLNIHEEDLVENFILGSGKGGQNKQKTSSCVYLKHLPTGVEIKCQSSRSRDDNRYLARRALCDKIEEEIFRVKTKKIAEIEKKRRQKRKRSKRAQEKILQQKKRRKEIKQTRESPTNDLSLS